MDRNRLSLQQEMTKLLYLNKFLLREEIQTYPLYPKAALENKSTEWSEVQLEKLRHSPILAENKNDRALLPTCLVWIRTKI